MKDFFTNKIFKIISLASDFENLTVPLVGKLKRYTVDITINKPPINIIELVKQAEILYGVYENLNLEGRIEDKTLRKYFNISTSFDNLSEVDNFKKENNL